MTKQQPVVVITGATSGIGKSTAEQLAKLGGGHRIVLACRNRKAADQVVDAIRKDVPGADVVVGPTLDLASLDSVRAFAKEYERLGWRCDVLLNNAGTNYLPRSMTDQGVGKLAQVNYLGAYALTRLLEPTLKRSAPCTVVNVSSIMHRMGCIQDPKAFLFDWDAGQYAETKLANVLFTYEAQRRLAPLGISSCALDPGAANTNIWSGSALMSRPPMSWVLSAVYSPPSDWAAAPLAACTASTRPLPTRGFARGSMAERHAPTFKFYARGLFASPMITGYNQATNGPLGAVVNALWVARAGLLSVIDYPLRRITGGRCNATTWQVPSSPASYDKELAARLWEVSADVVGVPRNPGRGAEK